MRVTFAYLKEIIVASSLIFVTAGALYSMTTPSGTGATQAINVERANKGDRLPYTSRPKTAVNGSLLTPTPQMQAQRIPLGCDPAFSPLADPTRALIYKRCAT